MKSLAVRVLGDFAVDGLQQQALDGGFTAWAAAGLPVLRTTDG